MSGSLILYIVTVIGFLWSKTLSWKIFAKFSWPNWDKQITSEMRNSCKKKLLPMSMAPMFVCVCLCEFLRNPIQKFCSVYHVPCSFRMVFEDGYTFWNCCVFDIGSICRTFTTIFVCIQPLALGSEKISERLLFTHNPHKKQHNTSTQNPSWILITMRFILMSLMITLQNYILTQHLFKMLHTKQE